MQLNANQHIKSGGRKPNNNEKYRHAFPLVFTARPWPSRLIGVVGLGTGSLDNPECLGIFDPHTKSVWIQTSRDSNILWTRGFFGKGNLSRSEPSWHDRQKMLTSEEITAQRREARKKFKQERAQALLEAAAQAEAAFAVGQEAPAPVLPSRPAEHLIIPKRPTKDDVLEEDLPKEPTEDLEHLQLTLPEAFFLVWGLGCLTIVDPNTHMPMSLGAVWGSFQNAYSPSPSPSPGLISRLDNPFLINYLVYHHYRSLGWIVKSGTKFCVDILLYKRGPVFSHAEFAILVIPVYENAADQKSSPFDLPNAGPISWTWLGTINRVNSQVQKTVILTYVVIPSSTSVSSDDRRTPACLSRFSLREVPLKRFIPARMRD
ncbi:hypothetical protein SISSUDRAFT_986972 [Sistotremastrum suecicum HHB10207 ss-3]|uniref:tRNA-splicing endonuclease subunit Sen2 n=1 Tax=Sistotremastrum suecicum HHB10207 ss-3 TaxID=1314776 RepID=A0A166CXZ3_9AGAM|nr:hypothetical protein SISSUDRAFT_986972 [Sistotremastrum suecicum HHB10207 ss-3]